MSCPCAASLDPQWSGHITDRGPGLVVAFLCMFLPSWPVLCGLSNTVYSDLVIWLDNAHLCFSDSCVVENYWRTILQGGMHASRAISAWCCISSEATHALWTPVLTRAFVP